MHSPLPRRAKAHRRRRLLLKLVLLAVVCLVCFLILEVGIRLGAPQAASWLTVYRAHPQLPMALKPNEHAVVDTGETHWEVFTDEHGRRRGSKAERSAKPTALWLGDSFAFGHGVDYEQSWIGLLDGPEDARFTHLNCGVPGYGPTHYELVLDEALGEVDTISVVFVATYLGNDFHDAIWPKDKVIQDGVMGNDGSLKSWMARNLHSYRLGSRVWHGLAGRVSREQSALVDLRTPAAWKVSPMRDAVRKYTAAMAAIARKCKERSLPLVVVVVPTSAMVVATRAHGVATTEDTPDERGTLVRGMSILKALGLRVIDLTPELAKHDPADLYFRFDGHFRPLGHELVADVLRRSVTELQK